MKIKKQESTNLIEMKNFIDYNEKIKKDDNVFEKLMFIYEMDIKELNTKIEIMQKEFKIFYKYDLIDHVNTRIKNPESIIKKMKNKECKLTYKEMIENINDIAGIRVICPLKKDIYSIKNLIQKLPGIETIKEKNYVAKPKDSGYSAYHLILGVPVVLSQNIIYVKVEVQIRTMAMDLWATLEHDMKYKTKNNINKKASKEWIKCAKLIEKVEREMLMLNN